jgi:hypothetical protein
LIEGAGEVMWADDAGRAGILFGELTLDSRRALKTWVAERESKKSKLPARSAHIDAAGLRVTSKGSAQQRVTRRES